MADVRLTATNPEDSSVVPVACNAKGELKLEEPILVEGPEGEKGDKGDPGDPFSGNFDGDVTFSGQATFLDGGLVVQGFPYPIDEEGTQKEAGYLTASFADLRFPADWYGDPGKEEEWTSVRAVDRRGVSNAVIYANGGAYFRQDVVIGSRNQQWVIVESNGLAHLVAYTSTKDSVESAPRLDQYPQLRNIPGELTMVEEQLQKVMERLKMAPEAGWEVWDGSD